VVEVNPLRDILREAKAQEDALAEPPARVRNTPAKSSAGVARRSTITAQDTPAQDVAGVRAAVVESVTPDTESVAEMSFGDFSRRWAPILRSGQMSVCRALFDMTYGAGRTECFTSMPKLAAAAGLKERQCYNVVAQLEQLGFIERPEIFNTPTKKGTVFRLYLTPQTPAAGLNRRYHIGGQEGN
jgi:hypothetical protein